MKTPRKTTRKVNTAKIKELFKSTGKSFDELSSAIGGVSARTLRRMAEEKDIRVSNKAILNVRDYFQVNENELYIADEEVSTSSVHLNEIRYLSNLYEHPVYRNLRGHHGHNNIRTLKIYDLPVDIYSSNEIKKLLRLSLGKNCLLTSYKHDKDSLENEERYIDSLEAGNKSISKLRDLGIYLYYGTYTFRGIEEKFLPVKSPFSNEEDKFYAALTDEPVFVKNSEEKEKTHLIENSGILAPVELKVEIFYFKKFFPNSVVPSKYKIFPVLGYTEKQLHDEYINMMTKLKMKNTKIVSEWIKSNFNLSWFIRDRVNFSKMNIAGTYLTVDNYIKLFSEALNSFKFFANQANSYQGKFEEVPPESQIRRIRRFSDGSMYENYQSINAEKETEDAMT